jgi:Fe-S cluster assembly protein SufD
MALQAEKENITEFFNQLYQDHSGLITGNSSPIVNNLRGVALDYLNTKGLPARKDEKYKYTFLEPHLKNGYNTIFQLENISFNLDHIFKCDVPALDTYNIVLLNGFYYEKFNSNVKIDNVIFGSFQKMAEEHSDIFQKHYGKYANTETDGLVSLNTLFTQDGLFLYVPKGVVVDKPIQVVNLLLSEQELMVQHRNLFICDENSQTRLIICDHTLSPQKFLTNSVSEIYAADNANLTITRVQNEHNGAVQISNQFIHQEANSTVEENTITLHGGIVRNNVYVKLNGEGAHNDTNGLYLSDGSQHIDSYTLIEHAMPNCTSNQLFKGILDDKSTGAFNGKIYVEKDAQKTSAFQRNNNILLTDTAKMNTKPQLEIYADDVKCSHGATVGQIDREALFYLRSRGINEKEARFLMLFAFANEIIRNIKTDVLRARINELVDKRLRGELSRCNNCFVHCAG